MLPEVLVPADSDAAHPKRTRRDWIVDGTFFVAALMLGAIVVGGVAAADKPSDEVLFLDVVGGMIACVLLWWRRRWPVQIAIVITLIGAFSAFSSAAGLIALFTVAVHRRFSTVLLVVVAGLVTVPIYIVLHPDATDPFWVSLVFIVLVTVATVAWGMFVRARRQLVLSLRERADRAEAEQQMHVEQERGLEQARGGQRRGAVVGLADDLEAVGIEQRAREGAEVGVVVDDQDARTHAAMFPRPP